MATESNNILTNSFLRGMNTDASMDTIGADSYVFGLNVRITTNTLLASISDSNSTEGIVSPVPAGLEKTTVGIYTDKYNILATASIENIGAVIVSKEFTKTDGSKYYKWYVYRVDLDLTPIKFSLLFTSEELDTIKLKFSVVINREMENVVKLYIADGVHQLMQINLMDDTYNSKITGNTDNITSNRIYPSLQTKISKLISGALKTSQILYTYRLYKKYGISSRLAPLTNKIQIIDSNRNKEEGNAEDTTTSIGLLIIIPIENLSIDKDIFDHVLVYRVLYIKAQEDAVVNLIYDSFIKDDNLTINDNGYTSLKQLTIDELSSINSMIIVPNNVEQNQNYMFISNIEDKTIMRIGDSQDIAQIDSKTYLRNYNEQFVLRHNSNPSLNYTNAYDSVDLISNGYTVNPESFINREDANIPNTGYLPCMYMKSDNKLYFGGEGKNVNWRFVTTNIVVHDSFDMYTNNAPHVTNQLSDSEIYYLTSTGKDVVKNGSESIKISDYLKQHGITAQNNVSYTDPVISSTLRSLRRDEVYRYGIVYYTKYGLRSDVLWIGDIRTPSCKQYNAILLNLSQNTAQYTKWIDVCANGSIGTFIETNINSDWSSAPSYTTKYVITSTSKANDTAIYAPFDCYARLTIDEHTVSCNGVVKNYSDLKTAYQEVSSSIRFVVDGSTYQIGENVRIKQNQKIEIILQSLDVLSSQKDSTIQGLLTQFNCLTGIYNIKDIYTNIKATLNYSPENSIDVIDLISRPIGIKFDINVPKSSGITSYLIVRCSKSNEYSRHIMQCALSRPARQKYSAQSTTTTLRSPYYPTPFLSSQLMYTSDYLSDKSSNEDNVNLFQLHSAEISLFPEDSLSLIHGNDSRLTPVQFNYQSTLSKILYSLNGYRNTNTDCMYLDNCSICYNREKFAGSTGTDAIDFKAQCTCNMYLYNFSTTPRKVNGDAVVLKSSLIEEVSSVNVPTWEQGFSNILLSGSEIIAGVKAYKSYVSTVKTEEYVNWICNGMYNLRICSSESQSGLNDGDGRVKAFTYLKTDNGDVENRDDRAAGWVGPGPQCILVRIASNASDAIVNPMTCEQLNNQLTIGSLICNIEHTAQQFAGFSDQEKQFDTYYGFGNYGNLTLSGDNMVGSIIVFDGDVYNLPCELVSMYKTYNFNSIKDTLPSALVVNYVPLETKINTFFDYGMNYTNTQSPNLLIEPGEITGVCSQDRPQHLYNPIYSDNNVSNDVYNALSEEWSDQKFSQRIFYSKLKTNGETIDNWSDFRALDYIDADTRYGKITHMLTNKSILYFWLSTAFGKLSVNERSLITDNNNNTIQLGQGGVLQRTDYIDTKYGIKEDHRSAINTNAGVFWIDILNKAVLLYKDSQVVNYGERLNVQNVINEKISTDTPRIDFDQLSDELLCKCLKNGNQLVFNTKLNCSTGVYTRNYSDIIYFNNTMYGLTSDSKIVQYNHLGSTTSYLTPTILSFVVNLVPSATKVFDNQQIITMKRQYEDSFALNFMKNKIIEFDTNIDSSKYDHATTEVITDRESNLTYCIPRINNSKYGNRLRGRWMKVTITDDSPKYDYSISHVLTKFRQSFN